jgi:hypothetical protein
VNENEPARAELDREARQRAAHSWQRKWLRQVLFESLAARSPEFRRAANQLATDYPISLSLSLHQIEWVIDALPTVGQLPRRMRPPQAWRNVDWQAYLLCLGRLCVWFGLLHPTLSWVCHAGVQKVYWFGSDWPSQPPPWVEALHEFLQERYEVSPRLSIDEKYDFYRWADHASHPYSPYPWLDRPPRLRGRPALQIDKARLVILVDCILRRLLGEPWEEIRDDCGLQNRRGDDDPTSMELAIGCRRLAKHLNVFRPL